MPLRVGIEAASPPFNYLDDSNQPQGFEIDLAREICARLQRPCEFVQLDWDELIDGLVAGRFDAIINGLAITPERRMRIAFSEPYFRVSSSFIGQKDSDIVTFDAASLADKRIGVAGNSAHLAYLEDRYEASQIETYGKTEEAALDLAAGRLDAVFGETRDLRRFLKSREGQCCRYFGEVPYDPEHFGNGIAVGLRKDDRALRAQINAALAALDAEGVLRNLRRKHL